MCGRPVSIIRRMIALATTSRGARSASSCWPCMKRLPSTSTRNAPSPRTASEISGCWPRESGPRYITVGWNCTNSRSRSSRTGPQRQGHAVAGRDGGVGGLREHLPEAARGQHDRAAVDRAHAVALPLADHVQGEARRLRRSAPRSRSTARACWMTSISGARSTAAMSARWISAPVASPPACAIRSRWWPPSRVSESSPSGLWSKLVPRAISSRTASGPSCDEDPHGLEVAGARAGDERVHARAGQGCRPDPAPRRYRPAPTGWSRRRARPW